MNWVVAQHNTDWIVPCTFNGVTSNKLKTVVSVQSSATKYYIGGKRDDLFFNLKEKKAKQYKFFSDLFYSVQPKAFKVKTSQSRCNVAFALNFAHCLNLS